jgi:hypothetical protein
MYCIFYVLYQKDVNVLRTKHFLNVLMFLMSIRATLEIVFYTALRTSRNIVVHVIMHRLK